MKNYIVIRKKNNGKKRETIYNPIFCYEKYGAKFCKWHCVSWSVWSQNITLQNFCQKWFVIFISLVLPLMSAFGYSTPV